MAYMPYQPDKYRAARTQPRQARGKERVRLILAAALEQFVARGLEAVTTNDIAKAARIPIGSLYRYFPNKDSIIEALIQVYVTDITAILHSVGEHPLLRYMSWDEVLTLMIDAWVDYSRLNGCFAFLYTEQANPRLRSQNRVHWQYFSKTFGAVLAKRCPLISERQQLVCVQFALAASELGISNDYADHAPKLYHEAVGAIAAYLMRVCDQHDHTGVYGEDRSGVIVNRL